MQEIDWSEAGPEVIGAMVADFENLTVDRGMTYFVKEHGTGGMSRNCFKEGPGSWLFVERPTRWNGEGLPPVGTVCEWQWSVGEKGIEYVTVKVVGHDEGLAVMRLMTGPRKGEYGTSPNEKICGMYPLRPLRTPEQIAAEKRKAAIDETVKRFALSSYPDVPWHDLFAQMYDLGCIKCE